MTRAAHLPFSPPGSPTRGTGRGARSNASGRFETEQRQPLNDIWGEQWAISDADENTTGKEDPPRLSQVIEETPRKIITQNTSPDVPFDQSINPYRGCEHGCIYCFARPTHAYMGLSPGLDFETRLFAKPNAAALLRRELAYPKYVVKPIAFGTNTDPYQPIERKYRIMRNILRVLSETSHPAMILTKSSLITRDIELLKDMAQRNLVKCALSITTQDNKLARAMEPRASTPAKRFKAIETLASAGIPVSVMTAPMIPGLNDDEMESLLEAAKDAGATSAGYTFLKLPREVSPLFQEWLQDFAPTRANRIMNHIRTANGGRDYDSNWTSRMLGSGPYAKLLSERFKNAVKRLGLNQHLQKLDVTQFTPPQKPTAQLNLF